MMGPGYVTTVQTTNVNRALEDALWKLKSLDPEPQESRNGPVLAFPGPLVTTLTQPRERVLFWDERDANPFFHLMESLWMLAGREDTAFPAFFAQQIAKYSDNGTTLAGAYGYRWRSRFGTDQIRDVIDMLRQSPETRRAVIQMWYPVTDLGSDSLDVPCNLSIVVDRRGGQLNFYLSNRSNDLIWGLYGANAVHFSVLQEYMAAALSIPVGVMTTLSVNAHVYMGLKKGQRMMEVPLVDDRYAHLGMEPYPLVAVKGDAEYMSVWDVDLRNFLHRPYRDGEDFTDPFFPGVAVPMFRTWAAHKEGDVFSAFHHVSMILADDWRTAAREWLVRRHGQPR